MFATLDKYLISRFNKYGVTLLRLALAVVFIWFGLLKIFDVSPVAYIVNSTFHVHSGFPILLLGVVEFCIGVCLLFKIMLRPALLALWLLLLGTFLAVILEPGLFYAHHLYTLTLEGEFVIKNLVLITASLVVAGREVAPLTSRQS
jgi:uncharacterized membrane protein YkgB